MVKCICTYQYGDGNSFDQFFKEMAELTWLWQVLDLDLRVEHARANGPDDLYTLLARWIVTRVTLVFGIVLWPLDAVLRILGRILTVFVIGLLLLLILTGIWWPVWASLVYSSRIWLSTPWSRPFLLVPGILLALFAYLFLMFVPDHQKHRKYLTLPSEWPLTWHLWKPPKAYIENSEYFQDDYYIGDGSDPYGR